MRQLHVERAWPQVQTLMPFIRFFCRLTKLPMLSLRLWSDRVLQQERVDVAIDHMFPQPAVDCLLH